jgi:hypothetical protein
VKNINYKNVSLIITGIILGAILFSIIASENFLFPTPLQIINQDGAGANIRAYIYSPWLWSIEKTALIDIVDRKNDGPEFKIKLRGEINKIELIHSGEDFSVIRVGTYYNNNSEYRETAYILHRVPKKDGKESVDYLNIDGSIMFVAPDESGYFANDNGQLTKYDWSGKSLASTKISKDLEVIIDGYTFNKDMTVFNIKLYDHNINKQLILTWDLVHNATSSKINVNY